MVVEHQNNATRRTLVAGRVLVTIMFHVTPQTHEIQMKTTTKKQAEDDMSIIIYLSTRHTQEIRYGRTNMPNLYFHWMYRFSVKCCVHEENIQINTF